MSSIFKRGKSWYVDFVYKGKRHRQSLGTRSKQVAELHLKDLDVKIDTERLDLKSPEKVDFDDFAYKFLEWYEVQNSENRIGTIGISSTTPLSPTLPKSS